MCFSQSKVSAGGLLAVMRFFFKNDFDVIAVSQRKYTRDATVSHKFAVDQLESMGLIYLAEGHAHDDIVALEMAYTTDGVVVSNDQFVDHMQLSQRFCNLCDRCVSIALEQVNPSDRYTMSCNNHYIAEHIFRFHRRPSLAPGGFNPQPPPLTHGTIAVSIEPTELGVIACSQRDFATDAFFSTPDNIRHEIVKEHRQNWTEDYRDQTISMIDEMLTRIRQVFFLVSSSEAQVEARCAKWVQMKK
ncbi:hypothetical protein COOONC_08863 [Cooperia oncophora]